MKRRECLKLIGGAAACSLMPTTGSTLHTGKEISNKVSGFGVSAITLGASGRENALEFHRFLRAGGFPEVTPTQAMVWWNATLLHVEFRNTEPNPRYRGNPGLAKPIRYPGNERFQISAYPDAVYVQYRPNWNDEKCFLFAADSSGACNSTAVEVDVQRSAQ